jgi:hypothetical protein
MLKLLLEPNPTFKAKVEIYIPGQGHAPVEFDFKYRDRDGVMALLEEHKKLKEVEAIMSVASGWDLSDEFNAESVQKLLKRYNGCGFSIIKKYFEELNGAREKNS